MKKHTLNRQGFSLVELMAILVILAISTSLALPSFAKSIRKNQFRKDSHELMATLRGFKLQAVAGGIPLHVIFENRNFIVTIPGKEPIATELKLHGETELTLHPQELYFSPQGWARPANLTLTRSTLSQIIIIDPLTARPYKKQRGRRK
jgi:prepilin-type N-terminal cleavage/methylation domain-containing protein